MDLVVIVIMTQIATTLMMQMKMPCGRVHFTSLLVATSVVIWAMSGVTATSGRLSRVVVLKPGARTSM